MILSVGKIIHTPGEKIDFQYSMDLSSVDFGGYCPVAEPVVVTGNIRNTADVLMLTGEMSTTLHAVCDRCGKEFKSPKTIHFECMLAEELEDEENEEIVLIENGNVDLGDIARTAFILNMDTKLLCSEDCKGLCYKCGANLNTEVCNCKRDVDPRFAALAKLLDSKE